MDSPFVPPGNENTLIARLPFAERRAFLEACDDVALVIGEEVAMPGQALRYAYFPVSGYLSIVTGGEVTDATELALVGNDGMFGLGLLLGVPRSSQVAIVQGAGVARRIGESALLQQLELSPTLRSVLNHYCYVSIAQIGQTAACNRSHRVNVRLARWLLMTQDCAHGSTFPLTHKFMAYMLGVRRAGITEAALTLQRQGHIRYSRGSVTVLDRAGLLAMVCGCYGALKSEYQATMGLAGATKTT